MATSGTDTFSLTRNQLILDALKTAGILGVEAQVAPAAMLSYATDQLNMMIKHWENDNIKIWKESHVTVFLIPGTNTYVLGASPNAARDTVIETFVTSTIPALTTNPITVTVQSTTGMTPNDNILIMMDNGAYLTSTIASITNSTQLVLAYVGTIPSSVTVGTSSCVCYTFTNAVSKRPLRLSSATLQDQFGSNRQLLLYSRDEYFKLPRRNLAGYPIGVYYDPNRANSGTLFVNQVPTDSTYTLQLEMRSPMDDINTATQEGDIPNSWLLALQYGLAVLLCSVYGKDNKKMLLQKDAMMYLQQANAADIEEADLIIGPYNE